MRQPPRWVYGLTTVPERRRDLLPRTLGSLRLAGFGQPRLFVDGASPQEAAGYEAEFLLAVTARWPRLRTLGNWLLGLAELYLREPAADRFAMFQDDLVAVRNLRAYLDAVPYEPQTYWNLYTFPQNEGLAHGALGAGKTGFYPSNQMGRGAVALVFDRQTVITLLTHAHMVERPLDAHRGWRSIDGGIVTALKKAGWRELVHMPSLVQHTGDVSTMMNGKHQQSLTFPGETFDAATLLAGQTAAAPATPAGADAAEVARLLDALAADRERLRAAPPGDRPRLQAHIARYTTALEAMRVRG